MTTSELRARIASVIKKYENNIRYYEMQEYIIYYYNERLPKYEVFLRKAKTLNILMYLLEEYGRSEEELQSYVRSIEGVGSWNFNLTFMRYEGGNRLSISFLFAEEGTEDSEDFVTTIPELIFIIDQWRSARIQMPQYIVMTKDVNGTVIIEPTNDQNDFTDLCVGKACVLR